MEKNNLLLKSRIGTELAKDVPKNTKRGKFWVGCFNFRLHSWGGYWLSVYLKMRERDNCEQLQRLFFLKNVLNFLIKTA